MFKVVVFSLGCFGRLCGSLDLRPEVDVSVLDCDLKVFLQPLGIELWYSSLFWILLALWAPWLKRTLDDPTTAPSATLPMSPPWEHSHSPCSCRPLAGQY